MTSGADASMPRAPGGACTTSGSDVVAGVDTSAGRSNHQATTPEATSSTAVAAARPAERARISCPSVAVAQVRLGPEVFFGRGEEGVVFLGGADGDPDAVS